MEHDNKWHLEKKLSVSHIFSTIVITATAFFYISNIENKVDKNTQSIEFWSAQQDQQRQEMRQDYRRIEEKLDRLIERQNGK